MLQYDSYRYLAPPRPENPIHPDTLGFYQKRKWWAQIKKNGTCSTIYLPPKGEGDPFARTRHGDEAHRAWQFTDDSIHLYREMQTHHWHVYCSELLHSKGHGVRDVNYIRDVLVYEGRHLINTTTVHRQGLLKNIFGRMAGRVTETASHFVIDEHTWLARNYQRGFAALYEGLVDPLDEGLVLMSSEAVLAPANNSSWMVKCRKAASNYGF